MTNFRQLMPWGETRARIPSAAQHCYSERPEMNFGITDTRKNIDTALAHQLLRLRQCGICADGYDPFGA